MDKTIGRALGLFDLAFMRFAQLSLFVMMLSISADALGRYLFNSPLQGGFEFTSLYLMVIITFLGMPGAYAQGGLVRLGALDPILLRIPGRLSERLNAALGAAVFAFISWHAGHEALEKFIDRDTTFGVIQFPVYWSYVWVPLGCGLLALRMGYEIFMPQDRSAGHEGAEA